MDEYRAQVEFEKFFQHMRKFCTPDEFGAILKALNNPERVHSFIITMKRIEEREARWRWVGSILTQTLKMLMAVGGLILLVRDVLPILWRLVAS